VKGYYSRGLMAVLTTIVLSGCSSAALQSSAPPTVDVTGTWTGNVQYGQQFFAETLRLQQEGAKVTGSGTVRLPQVGGDFTVEGTVSGNVLDYRTSPGGTGTGSLIVRGDEMSGTNASGLPLTLRRQGSGVSPKP